jgi:glycine cleavage system H protein
MSEIPEDCLYTKEHEWVRVHDGVGLVGITDYAQENLGDVVYVELPTVDDSFEAGDVFGNVESVKAVSELYMPVSGKVTGVNQTLADAPELVNQDPYGNGWMVKMALSDPGDTAHLLSASEYEEYIKEESKK